MSSPSNFTIDTTGFLRQLSSTSNFTIDTTGFLRQLSSTSNFAIDTTGFLCQLSSTIIFGGLVNHLLMDQCPFFLVDQHSSGLLRKLNSTSNFSIDATGFLRQLSSTSNFTIDATGFLRQLSSTIILVDWLTTFRSINILLMDWHSSGLLLLTFGGLALLWASPVICFHCSPVFTMASE